jgi:hypothetical protein
MRADMGNLAAVDEHYPSSYQVNNGLICCGLQDIDAARSLEQTQTLQNITYGCRIGRETLAISVQVLSLNFYLSLSLSSFESADAEVSDRIPINLAKKHLFSPRISLASP